MKPMRQLSIQVTTTVFNRKLRLTPNSKLYRAPKITCVKPFKRKNQRSIDKGRCCVSANETTLHPNNN